MSQKELIPTGTLPVIDKGEAAKRALLSDSALLCMHLHPTAPPVACAVEGDKITYYYAPEKVSATPARRRRSKAKARAEKIEEVTVPSPTVTAPDAPLKQISARRAEALGYYSAAALAQMYYEPTTPPVAFLIKKNGTRVELYDRATCKRLPLPCVCCKKEPRYRQKLCLACYKKELAKRRAEGEARRLAAYGKEKERVLFFDLEMTGVYERDEILSVSIVDGNGTPLFDTLVRPTRCKRWKKTEKIHGITPEMVANAPTIEEIAPTLKEILANADRLIAYGTSTDYMQLAKLYKKREDKQRLREKMLDCAAEFSHYVSEYELSLTHRSLTDAMQCFSLDWQGTAHTSAADAHACRLVFEKLFPNYYESEAI